ncbi:MAG: hypothetical protein ITD33_01685 [Nitrosarchaeum sp.]|nr:hypothetical protein [Nitrosarchaeum sp.]MBP0119564.1 hypothetical protein [Nitrosarchaeum sp.]MBP0133576.1 hypothetical protein [Nitrosarchaeum sp.]
MKVKKNTQLSIFDTFKIKGELTGEANRQRAIITILATNVNPIDRTRTGISQIIAKIQNIAWKNIYSGIFLDLNEILIPLGIVEEAGRLPLKRGPKALQAIGVPYYNLTKKGVVVALSISDINNRQELLKKIFSQSDSKEKEYERIITNLSETTPNFAFSIFQKYVKAFCNNEIKDLLPFDLSKLKGISDESLIIQKEILEVFLKLSKQDKEETIRFLNKIT